MNFFFDATDPNIAILCFSLNLMLKLTKTNVLEKSYLK